MNNRQTAQVAKPKNGGSMTVATVLVMIGLLFSKCSGFMRDIFVGIKFSDPVFRDSFTLAFTIPDLVYNLLIGGSIQSAITPSLSSAISRGEEKRGFRAVNIFISVFAVLMLIVCILGSVFSRQIYSLYNAFSGDANNRTVELASEASKLLFPQIFFMMLAALCIGILNAYKRFASTAFGPSIYNIFVLAAIIIFAGNSQRELVYTTAGIMGAAIIYFLFQYMVGFDKMKAYRFIWKPRDPDFIALVKRALPILISASIVQINMVILNYFAGSFDDDGHIYALRNASTVWQLPYGIFAVAIGNVMLPSLAALYSSGKHKDASMLLSSRLRNALFLTVPSAVFMIILNTDVIKAVFQWSSEYTDDDAARAGTFLVGYSIAIITHTVVFIMNQAFYAIGRTKIPLIAGCIGLLSNPLFCVVFIKAGMGPLSLTIAYSITSVFQLLTLYIVYSKQKEIAPRGMLKFAVKSSICAGIMALVLIVCDRTVPATGGKMVQLAILGTKLFVSAGVYFIFAAVLKQREATYWIQRFRSKLHI